MASVNVLSDQLTGNAIGGVVTFKNLRTDGGADSLASAVGSGTRFKVCARCNGRLRRAARALRRSRELRPRSQQRWRRAACADARPVPAALAAAQAQPISASDSIQLTRGHGSGPLMAKLLGSKAGGDGGSASGGGGARSQGVRTPPRTPKSPRTPSSRARD